MTYPPGSNPAEPFPFPLVDFEHHWKLTHQEVVAPTAGRITVLRVVDFGETRFLNDAGDELYSPHTGDDSQTIFEDLEAVHEVLGPGDHPEHQTLQHLHNPWVGINILARVMPPEVFLSYYNTDRSMRYVRIGNIAVLSRNATPEELDVRATQEEQARLAAEAAKIEKQAAEQAAEAARKQEKLEAIDRGKTPLTDYDHAIVTVGGRNFHIPTNRASTVLAVRVLQALAQVPQRVTHVEGRAVSHAAWALMPRADRELFCSKMADVIRTRGPGIVRKRVLEILRSLTTSRGIGVTRETTGELFKMENSVSVALHADPLPPDADLTSLTPIYTSEIPRDQRRWTTNVEPIPESAKQEAIRLLDEELHSDVLLSHKEAEKLLSLVTDRHVKRALKAALRNRDGGKRTVEAVTAVLRERARRSLDEGYLSAWRHRTVAGYSRSGAQSGISLVSGSLPGSTKWYIGEVREDRL